MSIADLVETLQGESRPRGRVDPEHRSASLLPLHATVAVLDPVVLTPWAMDRLLVSVQPDQVGWVGATSQDGVWVGTHSVADTRDATRWLGQQVAELLDPVVEAVAPVAGVTVRAARLVAYDAIRSVAWRLVRSEASRLRPPWADDLVAACGHTPRLSGTTIQAAPDAGPAVELPVPRTCCVLAVRPPDDPCPTCPLHVDDADRSARSAAWLAGLDDDAFAFVVGRSRQDHGQD
jgi:hypothetical protein